MRIDVEQRTGGDQHAWSAYAALRRAAFQKRLLQWVEPAVARQSFNCENIRALQLANRGETRIYDLAVNDHGASPTLALATTLFRASQTQVLSQHVEKPLHRWRVNLTSDAIDLKIYLHCRSELSISLVAAGAGIFSLDFI